MLLLHNEDDKFYSTSQNCTRFDSGVLSGYNFVQGGGSSQVPLSSVSSEDECSITAAADRSIDETQQKPFLQALMDLLSQEDPEIVTWLPSGTAFVVRSPKKFVEMVLPRFFKQTKIASFYRQLNMYGFRRIVDGPDMGAYHHELFVRDKPHLCSTIQRKRRTRKRSTPKAVWEGASIKNTHRAVPVMVHPTSESEVRATISAMSSADSNSASTSPPLPAADAISSHAQKSNSSSGYSIIVCDHANKSMVEVAHYASIPCDLQSFALGVGGLLADGIERHKASYAPAGDATTSEWSENYDMLDTYGDRYGEYCEGDLDVDICNMFQNEPFVSMYATAC